jgi:hypothetical protein
MARRHVARALIGLSLLGFAAAGARGAAISYSLTFCEDLEVLRDPTNETLMRNAAWAPQHKVMIQRTMPYFELRNTSEEASITQFELTIGDISKHFDWSQMIETSPGVTFSLITPDLPGGVGADTLLVEFTGLDPGRFVRFRFGIDADDPDASFVQDYRMTLFKLNGTDASSNSTATVTFLQEQTEKALTKQLPNFTHHGLPTPTSLALLQTSCGKDLLKPYTISDSGEIEPDGSDGQVPEPKSVALLAMGMLAIVLGRLWRGRII